MRFASLAISNYQTLMLAVHHISVDMSDQGVVFNTYKLHVVNTTPWSNITAEIYNTYTIVKLSYITT